MREIFLKNAHATAERWAPYPGGIPPDDPLQGPRVFLSDSVTANELLRLKGALHCVYSKLA